MTQKNEQSQRQERVAAWSRQAESDLSTYTRAAKQALQEQKPRDQKLCASLEEAIRRSGLQDGMTISFHHAFRGGDLTINLVMATLASMGFKNLTLASSSLSDCHAPLVDHIRNGVVSRIYTSGLRGPLAEEISRGLLAEPVQVHPMAAACIWYRAASSALTSLSSASRPAIRSVTLTAIPVKHVAAHSAMPALTLKAPAR